MEPGRLGIRHAAAAGLAGSGPWAVAGLKQPATGEVSGASVYRWGTPQAFLTLLFLRASEGT
jgi:hypothetical protein